MLAATRPILNVESKIAGGQNPIYSAGGANRKAAAQGIYLIL